jgi:hypothetical protein
MGADHRHKELLGDPAIASVPRLRLFFANAAMAASRLPMPNPVAPDWVVLSTEVA